MRSRLPSLAAALCAAAALLSPERAGAYERQWHAGVSLGYAALFGDTTSNGFGGGLHLAYGISDSFNLMADLYTTAHPSTDWTLTSLGLGAAYVLDVLQWVPWAGVEVGPAVLGSTDKGCGASGPEPCAAPRFDVAIPFGLDYRISRSFTVGVTGHFQVLVPGPLNPPWMTLGAFARAEYVWGY